MKDKNKTKTVLASILGTGSSIADSKRQSKESGHSSVERPTPLDFDTFVTWVCLEWQLPEVIVVTRHLQDEYTKQERRPSSNRSKNKSLKFKTEDYESTTGTTKARKSTVGSTVTEVTTCPTDKVLVMKAFYNNKGHLVEISITASPFKINKKVIQAISICLPFHSLLSKLTIRRGGVTNGILHEIGKMLAHSNLTDICLDDCPVPDGQYHLVIEQTSNLKCLSLNRCNIDDAKCIDLAKKIDIGTSGSSLLVLELGSNFITDKGAMALGESLRRNRRLLHLNLSGNMITDVGASFILTPLKKYKVTWDEIVDAKNRKLNYTVKKMEVYASCYEDILKRQKSELLVPSDTLKKISKTKHLKEERKKLKKNTVPSIFVDERSTAEIAEEMTINSVGKFMDPYDDSNVVQINGESHSKGNMVLCSLNLAYNNLSFLSIRLLYEVLKYQSIVEKVGNETGLLRVVFKGNYIPDYCVEYDRIEMFLKKAVLDNSPVAPIPRKVQSTLLVQSKKRTTSALASKRV